MSTLFESVLIFLVCIPGVTLPGLVLIIGGVHALKTGKVFGHVATRFEGRYISTPATGQTARQSGIFFLTIGIIASLLALFLIWGAVLESNLLKRVLLMIGLGEVALIVRWLANSK
jgi:hypothetical protein